MSGADSCRRRVHCARRATVKEEDDARYPLQTTKGPIALSGPFLREHASSYFPGFGGKFLNMFLMSPSTMLVFLLSLVERFSVAMPLHSSFFEVPSNKAITKLPTF